MMIPNKIIEACKIGNKAIIEPFLTDIKKEYAQLLKSSLPYSAYQHRINFKTGEGPLLSIASIHGQNEIVKLLLTIPQINLYTTSDQTIPLYLAYNLAAVSPIELAIKYWDIFWHLLAATLQQANFSSEKIIEIINQTCTMLDREKEHFYIHVYAVLPDACAIARTYPAANHLESVAGMLRKQFYPRIYPSDPIVPGILPEAYQQKQLFLQKCVTGEMPFINMGLQIPLIRDNINLLLGYSPLTLACLYGNSQVVNALVTIPHLDLYQFAEGKLLLLKVFIEAKNTHKINHPCSINYMAIFKIILNKMWEKENKPINIFLEKLKNYIINEEEGKNLLALAHQFISIFFTKSETEKPQPTLDRMSASVIAIPQLPLNYNGIDAIAPSPQQLYNASFNPGGK